MHNVCILHIDLKNNKKASNHSKFLRYALSALFIHFTHDFE